MAADDAVARILTLPSELILHCLALLPPLDLAAVANTCHSLHKAASTDSLWQAQVNSNLHPPLATPAPYTSFRDLFATHYPHWFLTRRRLWVSDTGHCGGLALSRYNSSTGNIEAFRVVAERGDHTIQQWSEDATVLVHGFEPHVRLHLDAPVLRLAADSPRLSSPGHTRTIPLIGTFFTASASPKVSRLAQEISMDCAHNGSPGHKTSFALARDLPRSYITPSVQVWPPLTIPAPARTRNLSASEFTSTSHRPTKFDQVSNSTFRVRRWLDFRNRVTTPRIAHITAADRGAAARGLSWNDVDANLTSMYIGRGEHVDTYGTIDTKAYTPTPQKPYRGIYCGDYSGHGCEFLLVMQPDEDKEDDLPAGLDWLQDWLSSGRLDNSSQAPGELGAATMLRMNQILDLMAQRDGFQRDVLLAAFNNPPNHADNGGEHNDNTNMPDRDDLHDRDDHDNDDAWVVPTGTPGDLARQTIDGAQSATDNEVYAGRIIAVKLTGDPHVPRGEITFIAPDISDKGLVRIATEDIFQGARVVRSAGHVANRGFVHDEYIPSHLILASHDCLAQYWQGFGHISFYKRVDLDALMAQT